MTPQHPPNTPADGQLAAPEALRTQFESGATVDELVAMSGLSYGTVLNRLREAGTVMRTSWQTRRMRQNPQARQRLAGHLRTLYEKNGRDPHRTRRRRGRDEAWCAASADRCQRHGAHHAADAADTRSSAGC